MRPTNLGFRDPRQETPGSYFPRVSHHGRKLSFKSPKGKPSHSAFSKSKRFNQYSLQERKTGFMVGPGTYTPIPPETSPTSPIIRNFHANRLFNNGYFYNGNHLVFKSGFIMKREKGIKVDLSFDLNRHTNISTLPANRKLEQILKSYKTPSKEDSKVKRIKKQIKKKLII